MARRATPLTTQEVVRTARAMIESGGIDACSMRSLAAELGVQPPALYRRVRDKDELLSLVLDDALADLEVPTTGSWQECMTYLMRRLRALMRERPHLLTLYLSGHLRPSEAEAMQARGAAPLIAAGFDREAADAAVTVLSIFTLGITSVARSVDFDDGALFEFGLARLIEGLTPEGGTAWTTSNGSTRSRRSRS